MNKLFLNTDDNFLKNIIKELNDSRLFDVVIDESNALLFYQVYKEIRKCKDCKGLNECSLASIGYRPFIKENEILYSACKYKRVDIRKKEDENNLNMLYLPKKVLEAKLDEYNIDSPERLKCYQYAMKFINNEEKKGMYIHGPFGSGKTYLIAAIANELAKRGKSTMLVYFPDLARDLKSSIDSGELENKINLLKTVDVLLIDDIGSENMTSWIRDEILSTILNYRYLDELPIFFTSNLEFKELANHLSNTKDGKDIKKGPRIVERIINMTKSFGVK